MPQPLRLVWRQLPGLVSYPKTILEEDTADYDAYWKEKRGGALGEFSPFQEKRARLVAELMETNAKVLDIGCGDGAVLNYLREQKQIEPWGVDLSGTALAQAEENGVKTIMGDLRDPKVLEAIPEVDYITALEVLEHVPHPEELLRALAPKCRKAFIVSFPNTGYWLYRLRLLFGRVPAQWRRHPGEHVRFWTIKDARWWIEAMGWELEQLKCYEGLDGFNRICPSWGSMGIVVKLKPRS